MNDGYTVFGEIRDDCRSVQVTVVRDNERRRAIDSRGDDVVIVRIGLANVIWCDDCSDVTTLQLLGHGGSLIAPFGSVR